MSLPAEIGKLVEQTNMTTSIQNIYGMHMLISTIYLLLHWFSVTSLLFSRVPVPLKITLKQINTVVCKKAARQTYMLLHFRSDTLSK